MPVIESPWVDPTRISDGADGDQPWPSDKLRVPTAKTLFAPNWNGTGGGGWRAVGRHGEL